MNSVDIGMAKLKMKEVVRNMNNTKYIKSKLENASKYGSNQKIQF